MSTVEEKIKSFLGERGISLMGIAGPLYNGQPLPHLQAVR